MKTNYAYMNSADCECIIWTHDGAWLQTTEAAGTKRSSYLGRRDLERLEQFCSVHGIELVIHGIRQHAHANGGYTCPKCSPKPALPFMA